MNPAVVAWFPKASVFHLVNCAPFANGGSNPIEVWCINCVVEETLCRKFIIAGHRAVNSGL